MHNELNNKEPEITENMNNFTPSTLNNNLSSSINYRNDASPSINNGNLYHARNNEYYQNRQYNYHNRNYNDNYNNNTNHTIYNDHGNQNVNHFTHFCVYCNQRFKSKNKMERHIRSHIEINDQNLEPNDLPTVSYNDNVHRPFICLFPKRSTVNIRDHTELSGEDRYKYGTCGHTYTNLEDIKNHHYQKHSICFLKEAHINEDCPKPTCEGKLTCGWRIPNWIIKCNNCTHTITRCKYRERAKMNIRNQTEMELLYPALQYE